MNIRNNTQRRILISTLTALLVIGLAAVAVAQGPGQGRGGRGAGDGNFGPEMRLERMTAYLDLTGDQVTALTEIRENVRTENIKLRKEIMQLRNEKRGEMLKDDPAEKTVLDLTGKIGDLRTELQTNRMSNRLEMRKVLTHEQRDKMLMMREHRGENRRGNNGSRCDEFRGGRQGKGGGSGYGYGSQRGNGDGTGRGNW